MNNYLYVLTPLFIILNVLPSNISYYISVIIALSLIILYGFKYKDDIYDFIKNPGIKVQNESESIDLEKKYISNLESYKKYNEDSFNNAIRFYKMYKDSFEKYSSSNYTHIYANSPDYYLGLSMNSYQEIGLSIPKKTYKQAIGDNSFADDSKSKDLYKNINNLYNYNIKKIYKLYKTKNDIEPTNFNSYMYQGPKSYEYEESIYKVF